MVEHHLREVQKKVDKIFSTDRPSAFANERCLLAPMGCGQPILGFKDRASAKEYAMTGLCQDCQDSFYEGLNDDD